MMRRILLSLTVLFYMTFPALSQIIQIPSDFPTIQAGIEAATEGDTVLVAEDTYYENIDFLGKAITVASRFILDGDPSHISGTIIDGSQSTNPDTSSVVMFRSGEDTTSVLTGFTITGGKGTLADKIVDSNPALVLKVGGGIFIDHAGGKATFNIVENNELAPASGTNAYGGGIMARGGDGQVIVLRHNTIRNNTTISNEAPACGAGAFLLGGAFIIENNTISHNSSEATNKWSEGGGMYFVLRPYSKEMGLIRNNIITNNQVLSSRTWGYGGGMLILCQFENARAQLLNNVIAANYSQGWDGGILLGNDRIDLINNTFYGNWAETNGNSLGFYEPCNDIVLFNNIFWSGADNEKQNIIFDGDGQLTQFSGLVFSDNILETPFSPDDLVSAFDNIFMEPVFEEGTYAQVETSPGVGRGVDAIKVDGELYVAPPRDLAGNPRPSSADTCVDIGALESDWPLQLLPETDLACIFCSAYVLDPAFQSDILNYELLMPDTYTAVPSLTAIPADRLAEVLISGPEDLSSASDADRTATITVESSDHTNQTDYSVLYKLLSTDASLSSLGLSVGELEPAFDPGILSYMGKLPTGTTEVPEVTYTTSDENATVTLEPATNLESQFKKFRTTNVLVTAEYTDSTKTYSVEFVTDDVNVEPGEAGATGALRIYPNPAADRVFVEFSTLETGDVSLEIYNATGQAIETILLQDLAAGEHRVGVSVEDYFEGLYFAVLQQPNGVSAVQKLLVQH